MRLLLLPFIWLGRALHWLRMGILNLLTLAILLFIIIFLAYKLLYHVTVPDDATLLIAPHGALFYSRSESWQSRVLNHLDGQKPAGVSVRQMVQAIDRASTDARIHLLELNLSDFSGGSITQLDTVARALQRFRAHGKPIYAYAPNYSQDAYLLAAQADHIYMPKLGAVLVTGFSTRGLYFKGLLDKLGITVYSLRQGKYKSAMEPITLTHMSKPAQVENAAWLKVWWNTYRQNVAKGRGLKATKISYYANHLPELLVHYQGNAAELALKQGLITHIGDAHAFRRAVAAALKQPPRRIKTVGLHAYLAATKPSTTADAKIAVVPIDGMLVTGDTPLPGIVAAQATVNQLNRVRHDASVKAVVLQVNSPGGDVNAAQAIRAAIIRLRKAHKPVVVSMGTLGTSGAYWLSTAADRIYAHPTTLTADIGVFALFPNYAGLLKKLGIHYSGVATTRNANALSPFSPMGKNVQKALQAVVDNTYADFVKLVANARHIPIKKAEHDAQGRAWSGLDAYHLGLVNALGGMPQAIQEAAKLTKLSKGKYQVQYLPQPTPSNTLPQWLNTWSLASLRDTILGESSAFPGVIPLEQIRLLLHEAHPYALMAYLPLSLQDH
ncbi:signal peptide peptidase SppA [Acidithiobacillus sp.]|jgi:protease-4|uniref:signal peptide peptidase SppA n=1 Tax=Acidithiobacillus sp. TaxID=1872118 RepID=UPI0035605EF4